MTRVAKKPLTKEKKEKNRPGAMGITFDQFLLMYEDPDMYQRVFIKKSLSAPLRKESVLSKLMSKLIISKNKAYEDFSIIDRIPESPSVNIYLEEIAKFISGSIEIEEKDLKQHREEAYKNAGFSTLSLQEAQELEVKYERFFDYLCNKNTKTPIPLSTFNEMLKLSEELRDNREVIYRAISSEDSLSMMEEGLSASIEVKKTLSGKPETLPISFYPGFILSTDNELQVGLFKGTLIPFSKFKEEFFKFRYDLEVAHTLSVLKQIYPGKPVVINILCFDQHGRSEWFWVSEETRTIALREYEKMIPYVSYPIYYGYTGRPMYMTDENRIL